MREMMRVFWQYVDQHTGGEEAITRYAGTDNTVAFKGEQHPLKAREVLDEVSVADCIALIGVPSFTLVVWTQRRRTD
jgi:cytochrome b involved in lipid metabolism